MKKKLSIVSKASISALLLASIVAPNVASAAQFDIWNGSTKVGNLNDMLLQDDKTAQLDVVNNGDKYRIELPGGQTYLYNNADAIAGANSSLPSTELYEKIAADLKSEAQASPEGQGTLAVSSVTAINATILKTGNSNYKLALDYLDKDGKSIPTDKLPADLTVSYTDSKDVFNTDGTIKNKQNIPNVGEKITVVVKVTSASANLNLTQEFTVGVVKADDWASVADAKIMKDDKVELSSLQVGTTSDIKLVPTGVKKSNGTDETNPTDWGIDQIDSVTSSANTILIVNHSSNKVTLKPIMAGTATVTVTLKSGFKFTKEITVKDEGAAKVTSAVVDKETLTLSSVQKTGTVKVTILDQYGNPMKGQKVTVKAAGQSTNTFNVKPSQISENGQAIVTVTANDSAKTGSDTLNIYVGEDETKALGFFKVDYVKAGAVASYGLQIKKEEDKSDDAELDVYNPKDNKLNLELVGKDANGNVAQIYSDLSAYTASVSNTSIADVKISNGIITVTAKSAGTTTLTVKEGNIQRATFEVTVKNSTPAVNQIAVKSGASLKLSSATTLTEDILKSLLAVSGANGSTFDIKVEGTDIKVMDGKNSIGTIALTSTKTEITVSGLTINSSNTDLTDAKLVASLKQNDKVVSSVEIPIVMDTVKPKLVSATVNAGGFDSVGDTLTLTFDEEVQLGDELQATGTTLANLDDFLDIDYDGNVTSSSPTLNGENLSGGSQEIFDISVEGKTVTITVQGTVTINKPITSETTINISDTSNILDLAGNEIDSTSNKTPIAVEDKAAPSLIKAVAASAQGFDAENDTLVLTFDEKVKLGDELQETGNSLDIINDFLYVDYDGKTGKEPLVVSNGNATFDIQVNDNIVTITLKGSGVKLAEAMTTNADIKIADTSNLTDLVGNEANPNAKVDVADS